jgi:4-hydroxybenzoate polyprenyltransferase
METRAVFTLRELTAFLRERYDARRFVPLALLLGAVGMIAAGARFDSPAALMQSVVISYLLVLAFRVWDDIEDRERDRREHPERVLARSATTAPWLGLIAFAFLLSAAIVSFGPRSDARLGIVAAGAGALFAWYRIRRRIHASPLVGMSVVFAKYPLIAFVAAPPSQPVPPLVTALSLIGLYAALCSYELVDDTALRGSIP